jgi:Xaa-Pro aminopeptidase
VLTRELSRDPIAAHFGGGNAVGRMAIAIEPADGAVRLRAVCASYDVAPLEDLGIFDDISAYGREGWDDLLRRLTGPGGSAKIALDYSSDDPFADGLSHTMRAQFLRAAGAGTEARLVSSEALVSELFGRKTEWEIERVRHAATEADEILRWALSEQNLVPDQTTETELAEKIADETERRGHGFSWDRAVCPSVQFKTTRGHAAPGSRTVSYGEIVAVDFGVEIDGYRSDLQRTLVVTAEGKISPEIARLWDVTFRAVEAAAAVMRPGVPGETIDRAARGVVVEAGYPEYVHATGHPLGYETHDVGPILGPNWPGRYGGRVHQPVLEGMIFTLEPAAAQPTPEGDVRIGLEEDVVVRETGVEFLCPRQDRIWRLG